MDKSDTPGEVRSMEGLGVTRVTKWFRHDHLNGWQFNHLEDGHADTTHPTPKFVSQDGWRRATWSRCHAWLTADKPPKLVYVGTDEL